MHSISASSGAALILLALVVASGSIGPAETVVPYPSILVEPALLVIPVSSTFDVDIWIRYIPMGSGIPIYGFSFVVTWEDSSIQLIGHTDHVGENTGAGWTVVIQQHDEETYTLVALDERDVPTPFSVDASWVTLTFHCLGPDGSDIGFLPEGDIHAPRYVDSYDEPSQPFITVVGGEVTQFLPEQFTSNGPVGGVVTPVNAFALLAPWFAVIGLVGCVATVAVVVFRKKTV